MNYLLYNCFIIAQCVPSWVTFFSLLVFCCSFMAFTRENTVNYDRACTNQNKRLFGPLHNTLDVNHT